MLNGVKDQRIFFFVKRRNITAIERIFEWRVVIFCVWPCIGFWLYWTHEGPQRSRMGSDDFPTCGGLLWCIAALTFKPECLCVPYLQQSLSFQDKQKTRLYTEPYMRSQNRAWKWTRTQLWKENAAFWWDGCAVWVDFGGFFISVLRILLVTVFS